MNKNISIILAVVIVVLATIAVKVYEPQKQVFVPTDVVVVEKPYTNREGKKWGPLPVGDWPFTVASAKGDWPRFVSGEINPPDVH
ncbi:MAG: hypothetical protein AAB505_01820, partial [Patescibacteria group bacterium]